MDSKFLSSYSSVNNISDIDEHSGLKRLEKHLGNNHSIDQERKGVEKEGLQDGYQDEEVIDSNSNPIQEANVSITSKRRNEYQHR